MLVCRAAIPAVASVRITCSMLFHHRGFELTRSHVGAPGRLHGIRHRHKFNRRSIWQIGFLVFSAIAKRVNEVK